MQRLISTVLVSVAGFAALAASGTASAGVQSSHALTRAEVKAELQRARASGELALQTNDLYGTQLPQTRQSTLSRAEVTADLQRARASGELARETDELYGLIPAASASTASVGAPITHAEVRAETARAAKSGELRRQSNEFYPSDRPI